MILQKKVVRLICHVPPRASTEELYPQLGIIKFNDLNKFLISRFMFRWYNNKVPSLSHDFFVCNRDVYQYSTCQKEMLHVPQVKTNLGKQCIRYRGAVLWNAVIKLGISVETSEAIFVRTLKKNLNVGCNCIPLLSPIEITAIK